MKPRTRDNLIYLAVGLAIAALVTADFFYGESRGQEMWLPSRFAFRLVCVTGLLWYFVLRETLRMKATLVQVLAGVLFGSIVQLAIALGFRQPVGELPGIPFAALAAFELFLVVQLVLYVVRHLKSG